MRQDPAAKSKLSFLKGSTALEREEYKLAEVGFAQALHEDPNNARAMIYLLYAQLKRRPSLRQVEGLQDALKMAPQDTLVLRTAAKVYVILDQAGKAINLLEKARSLDPLDPETQAELAAAYLSLRKRPECEVALTAALKIDAANAAALAVKKAFATVYFDAAPAIKAEEQPLRKSPGTAESFLMEGSAALARNEWAAGYWNLKESLRLNPRSVEAQAALTAALRRRFPLYDWFFKFSLQAVRWHVVTSFVLVYASAKLIALAIGDALLPAWERVGMLGVVAAVVGVAALLLWPMPIVNYALRFHPIGRSTLSRVDRAENLISSLTLLTGIGCFITWPLLSSSVVIAAGGMDLALFLGMAMTSSSSKSSRAILVGIVTVLWVMSSAVAIVSASGIVAAISRMGS